MARGSIRLARLALALTALLVFGTACSADDTTEAIASESGDQVVAQLPDLAGEFVDAVFRVETEGCGWIGSGSGFAIDAHHVVTNHHVVANDSSPVVRTQSGAELHGRVIGSSVRPDLAVIQVDDELPTTVQWADTAALQRDEGLVVMGFPVPERTFKVSTGSVIGFQPPDSRDALIANNPIDRGNSGGPALRRDGTVAGVVTEMATREEGGERVAIVFTSNSVRRVAQGFIDAPTDVLSSCGLGPDYVPEVPKDFDLPPLSEIPSAPEQPDPAALPDVFAPTTNPSIGTLPTAPTTRPTLPCPNPDSVRVDITEATVERTADDTLAARVTVEISNDAPYAYQLGELRLSTDEAPGQFVYASLDPPILEGRQRRFLTIVGSFATSYVVNADVRLQGVWAEAGVLRCPGPLATDRSGFSAAPDDAVPAVG